MACSCGLGTCENRHHNSMRAKYERNSSYFCAVFEYASGGPLATDRAWGESPQSSGDVLLPLFSVPTRNTMLYTSPSGLQPGQSAHLSGAGRMAAVQCPQYRHDNDVTAKCCEECGIRLVRSDGRLQRSRAGGHSPGRGRAKRVAGSPSTGLLPGEGQEPQPGCTKVSTSPGVKQPHRSNFALPPAS